MFYEPETFGLITPTNWHKAQISKYKEFRGISFTNETAHNFTSKHN